MVSRYRRTEFVHLFGNESGADLFEKAKAVMTEQRPVKAEQPKHGAAKRFRARGRRTHEATAAREGQQYHLRRGRVACHPIMGASSSSSSDDEANPDFIVAVDAGDDGAVRRFLEDEGADANTKNAGGWPAIAIAGENTEHPLQHLVVAQRAGLDVGHAACVRAAAAAVGGAAAGAAGREWDGGSRVGPGEIQGNLLQRRQEAQHHPLVVGPAAHGGLPRPLAEEDDLWRASVRGDLELVQWFVQAHRDSVPAGRFDIDVLGPYGRSALYQAALGGHSGTVQWLISQGAADSDGTAYLACTNPGTRTVMAAAGFKGKQFNTTLRVRLIRAERRLVVALATMHERVGSEDDGVFGLDFDILQLLVREADKCFRDAPSHRRTLKRWQEQAEMPRAPLGVEDGATLARHPSAATLARQRSAEQAQGETEDVRHGTLQAKAVAVLADEERAAYAQELEETQRELELIKRLLKRADSLSE